MAPISFYSEGAVGKGLEPLVAEGAGVRTRVSLFQVLVSLEQHPSLMLGFQQIFHALLGHPPPPPPPNFHPYSWFRPPSSERLPWILPRGPSAIQVVPAAKACPTLDVEGVSLYLILLTRLRHLCVQHLYAIFGTTTGYPEAWHHFRKCLSLGVGGRQAANGM